MKIFVYITVLLLTLNISADEYWRFNEYMKKYPEQVTILKEFKTLIENNAENIKIKQKQKTEIVIIYPDGQVSDYWRRNILALRKRLKESKVNFNLELIPTPTGGDVKSESKKILEAIKKKPDYLIFTLNVKEHSKLINQVLSYSSIKLILWNITTPLKSWGTNQPFFYAGFDHEMGTQKIIDEVNKRIPEGGNFIVLYQSRGYVSTMRGDYAINQLTKDKKWKLISRYYTEAKEKKIDIAMDDFYKNNKKVDLVFSSSTDISLSTKKYKKNSPFLLNGWGGGSAELQSIKNESNGLDFTVMRINDDTAVATAEAIKLDLQGDTKKVPQFFSGEMIIVDKETSKKKILFLENKAFRYSNE